jgi:hypothetical protein
MMASRYRIIARSGAVDAIIPIQKIIRSSGAVKARCAISRRIRRVGPKIRRKKGRRNEDGIWATVVFE